MIPPNVALFLLRAGVVAPPAAAAGPLALVEHLLGLLKEGLHPLRGLALVLLKPRVS